MSKTNPWRNKESQLGFHYFLKGDSSHVAVIPIQRRAIAERLQDFLWTDLSADLVSALASLEMNDFPHLALELNWLLPSWTNFSVDWGPWLRIAAAA